MALAAEWLGAASTFALAGVASVTAWQAYRQFLSSTASDNLARQERRQIAKDEARPYVVVYLDPTPNQPKFLDVVVQNFGKTMAREVGVSFEPALRRAAVEEYPDLPSWPSMAPGWAWRTLFDFLPERRPEQWPDEYRVRIVYRDDFGKQYIERMTLNVEAFRIIMFVQDKH